ncbi:hypothetical protein BLA29_000371 [Euroglyphus maynei]|uniref:Uncharacterized protein n=1 Tax=Euroglyphus maynei TaxID=6958 RepID=A0A1Y3AQ96_EURMA|nr:hypothetical protein BLA29_000371 [Euroglyphus maynei]
MSFAIISSVDALYGPTAISTEDSVLHEQLTGGGNQQQLNEQNSLTLSLRRHRKKHDRSDHKLNKGIRKCEAKLSDCRDEEKAEKLREKMEALCQRKKDRIAINQDTKINYDPHGKSIVFKVEDSPVRVLNKLHQLGYTVVPSPGGKGAFETGLTWTLFRPNYEPTPIYPKLNDLISTD